MAVGGSTPHIVRAGCRWPFAIMSCSTLPSCINFEFFGQLKGKARKEFLGL